MEIARKSCNWLRVAVIGCFSFYSVKLEQTVEFHIWADVAQHTVTHREFKVQKGEDHKTPTTSMQVYRNLGKGLELPWLLKRCSTHLYSNVSVARVIIQLGFYLFLGLLLYNLRYFSLPENLPQFPSHVCPMDHKLITRKKEDSPAGRIRGSDWLTKALNSPAWQKRLLYFYPFGHLLIKY